MELSLLSVIIVLFAIAQNCSANTPCCKGENVLMEKTCGDGSRITALSCELKYLTGSATEKNITVDKNGNLVLEYAVVPPDMYCYTSKLDGSNKTDIYLVCYEPLNSSLEETIFTVDATLELVSVCFIVITIVVYLHVPDLLDLQGVAILHSISGLAISFLALGINQLTTHKMEETLCLTFAYVTYFSMLYAFFWLNILSFHIWRVIVKPNCLSSQKHWAQIYHAVGMIGPTILLIILLVAHHSSALQFSELHPGLGETRCWFKSTKSQFLYFYLPMSLLLCLNIIYYAWTITVLWKEIMKSDQKNIKVLKYKLILCVKLFIIMGITWIFEILSAAFEDVHPSLDILWFITDCINTLQGVLIFLILVVFRKKVIRGLANRSFCGTRLPSRWKNVADDECDELEEEFVLSETQVRKN